MLKPFEGKKNNFFFTSDWYQRIVHNFVLRKLLCLLKRLYVANWIPFYTRNYSEEGKFFSGLRSLKYLFPSRGSRVRYCKRAVGLNQESVQWIDGYPLTFIGRWFHGETLKISTFSVPAKLF